MTTARRPSRQTSVHRRSSSHSSLPAPGGVSAPTATPPPQPGTWVRQALYDGGYRDGQVMPYDRRFFSTFPVRFTDGIWRIMGDRDVTVLSEPTLPYRGSR